MMREPKIPMLPMELPQQRIHEVVELPERPAEFNCEVDYRLPAPSAFAPHRGDTPFAMYGLQAIAARQTPSVV